MKRVLVWAETSMLILAIGLTGISFSEEQTKEKAPQKALSSSGHGKTTEKANTRVEKTDTEVVAKVNGADITFHELVVEMNQIAPSFIKDPTQRTPEIDKKVKETALGFLVFRELAVQEAVRRGIKATPSAVEETRKQLEQSLGSEDNYRKYLQEMGLTEASLGRLLKRDILFNQIIAKEIFQKAKANNKAAIEKRKKQWEKDLKKKAKIEILLPKVEKEMLENAHKGK